jgi:hypothetical protein
MTAYELLTLGVEAYLRELDEAEFAALTRRVRPPKPHWPDSAQNK